MAKIVIIDDDRAGCLFLAAGLKIDGHTIATAYDAMSGFTLVLRERPDLLILDLSMPAGGGSSVAERMRRIPAVSGIPILVITGTDDAVNRTRATEMGAVGFLLKPLSGQDLRLAVDAALGP